MSGLLAGIALICNPAAAYSVIVGLFQTAGLCDVPVKTVGIIIEPTSFGQTVSEKIDNLAFEFHGWNDTTYRKTC